MTTLQAQAVLRAFRTGSTTFPDPGPTYTPQEVKDFYQQDYGFLVNFEVSGPTFVNGIELYEFVKDAGTKG